MIEREPDLSEDPRRKDTGEGYPEQEPEEVTPDDGEEQGPATGTGRTDAPETSAPQDEPPGHATGNPDAAG